MISIIVPAYNAEKSICRCIDSILNQKDVEFEVIIVDDGSSDGTAQLCQKYKELGNVKLITKENGGVSSARNEGLRHVEGEYVMFVDSDDYIADDLCYHLYEEIQQGYDMVISSFKFIYEHALYKKERYIGAHERRIIDGSMSDKICDILEVGLATPPFARLYRRELIDDIWFVEGVNVGEDVLFNIECYKKNIKILIIPYVGYYYIQTTGSITHTFKDDFHYQQLHLYKTFCGFGEKLDKKERFYTMIDSMYYLETMDCLWLLYNSDRSYGEKRKIAYDYISEEEIQIVQKCAELKSLYHKTLHRFIQKKKISWMFALFRIKKIRDILIRRGNV